MLGVPQYVHSFHYEYLSHLHVDTGEEVMCVDDVS